MDRERNSGPNRSALDQVLERDIDIILLEELHCEPKFSLFLTNELFGSDSSFQFIAAWNSVTESSLGESDVVAVFDSSFDRVGLLLENKIRADFMPDQAMRYGLRGTEGITKGWWERFNTCLVAPMRYLSGVAADHIFDFRLPYEKLVPYFRRAGGGTRGEWRVRILEQAIAGAKGVPYVMRPDKATTDFFTGYWELASREFPELRLKRQEKRPRGSVWIYFPDVGLPKNGIYLVHKADHGFSADLSFRNTRVEDLIVLVSDIIEPGMYLQQANKSAVIRIDTPRLDVIGDFSVQRSEARACLEAIRRLLQFYRKHANCLSWPLRLSS